VPTEHAIRGFHGVTLLLENATKTSAILTDVFGFKETVREGSIIRLKADNTAGGKALVDAEEKPAKPGEFMV
jgi:glyoxalase family protein